MQTALAVIAVALCVAWLGRMAWRRLRGRSGGSCGCSECPAQRQPPRRLAP